MFDGTAAAYVLLLGVMAAFNPCGFALLPAYITMIVTGTADAEVPRPVALRRAVSFGLAMTVGFMAVFTAFGLLFGGVSLGLQGSILPYVSYVTVVIGIALMVLGGILLVKGELRGPGFQFASRAPRTTFWSQVGYGASFAIASLSCTIGLFLAVVAQALIATNPAGAVLPFVVYGIGMGASVVAVSLLAALAGSSVAAALRSRTTLIMRIGGGLMVVAGAFVIVYGLAEILISRGSTALAGVLTTTEQWRGAITSAIQGWGTPVLVGLVAVVAAIVVWVFISGRADARSPQATDLPDEVGSSAGESNAVPAGAASTPAVASAETMDALRRAVRDSD